MASDFNNLQLVITEVDGSVIAPEITVSQNDTFSAVGRYRQHPWKILIQTGTEQNCINIYKNMQKYQTMHEIYYLSPSLFF